MDDPAGGPVHDLVLTLVRGMAKLPVIPVPGGLRFQPVDPDEVAARLVELTLGKPAGLVPDLAGPKVYGLRDLIGGYLQAVGKHRVLMPVRMPGKVGNAYGASKNLSLDGPMWARGLGAQARYAGLDAFISSYWGRDSRTARRLPLLLNAAGRQGLRVAAYYEPESLPTPPSSSLLSQDFDFLHQLSAHPAWLRVNGKPVLFVYNIGQEGSCPAVNRLLAANQARFYLNLKVFPGYRDCQKQPDSWHQYVPADSYDQQGTDSATISPGFFKFDELTPRLPRDPKRFYADLRRQVSSGARWQLVTSFNEWGEGTAVEPSQEWQTLSGHGTYLDAMRSAYS